MSKSKAFLLFVGLIAFAVMMGSPVNSKESPKPSLNTTTTKPTTTKPTTTKPTTTKQTTTKQTLTNQTTTKPTTTNQTTTKPTTTKPTTTKPTTTNQTTTKPITTKPTTTKPTTTNQTTTNQTTTKPITTKPTTTKPTTTKPTTTKSTTPIPTSKPDEPTNYIWSIKNDNKSLCFFGDFALRMEVTYMSINSTIEKTYFDYKNTSLITNGTKCKNDSFDVVIRDVQLQQNLTLTFKRSQTDFFLSEVLFSFIKNKNLFINSTDDNSTLKTSSYKDMMLLKTPLNTSYECSLESQIHLMKVDNVSMYLRVIKVNQLQAFSFSNDSNTKSKCFHDQKQKDSAVRVWKAKDGNQTCAILQSNLNIFLEYTDVSGKPMMVNIPVTNDSKLLSSKCSGNSTSFTIAIDDTNESLLNLTLKFTSYNKSTSDEFYLFTTNENLMYSLNEVTFRYMGSNKYIQNHRGYNETFTSSKLDMKFDEVDVGNSYKCSLSETLVICNDKNGDNFNLTLSSTQWQAFKVVNDTFSPASHCPEEVTTPAPTVPVTIVPVVPEEPTRGKIVIKNSANKNITCLIANIALQLRTVYQTTSNDTAETGFNFMMNESKLASASCDEQFSNITFIHEITNTSCQIKIFSKFDTVTNTSSINSVYVEYKMSEEKFPQSKEPGKTIQIMTEDISVMETPKDKCFSCHSNETEIYLKNGSDIAILRIKGVQWQTFNIVKSNFSDSHQCFGDIRPTSASQGDWKVKENNNTCARYKMKVGSYITYPTMKNEEATVFVPLDSSAPVSTDSVCGNASSGILSTLLISMDMGKINFTFSFNETSDGKSFELESLDFSYDSSSKFFPNHLPQDKFVLLKNNSLEYFQADQSKSYKCSSEQVILYKGTTSRVDISDVQLQPFGVAKNKNGEFSSAYDCNLDDFSPLIPILVGAVLALLIVIVLVAYIIGRKRASSQNEYSTI